MGILLCVVGIDCLYYGQLTVPPVNFFNINVTQNVAALFGVKEWHWNFTNVSRDSHVSWQLQFMMHLTAPIW